MTDPLTAVELPEGGALCAVSGGLDSMCLLHFAFDLPGFETAAAHFNHQLRGPAADRDEAFVKSWCGGQGIPLFHGHRRYPDSYGGRGTIRRRGRAKIAV